MGHGRDKEDWPSRVDGPIAREQDCAMKTQDALLKQASITAQDSTVVATFDIDGTIPDSGAYVVGLMGATPGVTHSENTITGSFPLAALNGLGKGHLMSAFSEAEGREYQHGVPVEENL